MLGASETKNRNLNFHDFTISYSLRVETPLSTNCRRLQQNQFSGVLDVLEDLPLKDLYFFPPYPLSNFLINFTSQIICAYILNVYHRL